MFLWVKKRKCKDCEKDKKKSKDQKDIEINVGITFPHSMVKVASNKKSLPLSLKDQISPRSRQKRPFHCSRQLVILYLPCGVTAEQENLLSAHFRGYV